MGDFLYSFFPFKPEKKSETALAVYMNDKSQPNLYNLVLFGVCSPFFPVDIESRLSYVSSHESQAMMMIVALCYITTL